MINAKAKVKFDGAKVRKAAKAGNITSLGHAGGAIRLTARRSIKQNAKYAPPGRPPNTRKGRLRNAIMYAVEKALGTVVIGPDVGIAGTSGMAHEFGGRYKKQRYDKRPFMGPALQQTQSRLPSFWANSIKDS